jgi:hypothetical protein
MRAIAGERRAANCAGLIRAVNIGERRALRRCPAFLAESI